MLQTLLALEQQAIVTADDQAKIKADFAAAEESMLQRESASAAGRRLARESSLVEGIRQLLQEAAYIELAKAFQRDLFDQSMPLDFSSQTYEHLRQQKVPFAGAMRLVGNGLPPLRPDDPLYLKCLDSRKDVLTRRFEGIRTRLIECLRQLVEIRQVRTQGDGEADAVHATIRLEYLGSLLQASHGHL